MGNKKNKGCSLKLIGSTETFKTFETQNALCNWLGILVYGRPNIITRCEKLGYIVTFDIETN